MRELRLFNTRDLGKWGDLLMIEVSGLSKRYGAVQALNNVSFSVAKGQIVGFLGANGAGKTTTMDIMCGCIGADAGTATIAGYDITEQPLEVKRRLGYLPDVAPLHPEMRIEEFVTYAGRLHKIPGTELQRRVSETLEKLSLGAVRRRLIGNLSKGYRQRVALAQAIVHNPDVLVLDEPTEGLDPNQIVQIRELIRSLAGHHTIILSSHILSEVQNTCDHLIIVHNGTVVQTGSYEDLTRAMKSGRIYRLKVARNGAAAMSNLAELAAAQHPRLVDAAEHELEFSLAGSTDEAVLDNVARRMIDGGFGLRELAVKTKSLEEVFFQLTQ